MSANVETMAFRGRTLGGSLPWHFGTDTDCREISDESILSDNVRFMRYCLAKRNGPMPKMSDQSPPENLADSDLGEVWEVGTEPIYDKNNVCLSKLAQLVRRLDNDIVLGIVGPRWTPLANSTKFEWFQPFLDSAPIKMETGGSLDEGRKVWAMAKIEGLTEDVKQNDGVTRYVMLSDSNDGSNAVRVGFTDIRIVCQNTLRAAIASKASKLIRIRHNRNVTQNVKDMAKIIDIANQEFQSDLVTYRRLAQTGCCESDLRKYVKILFAPESVENPEAEISTRLDNIMENIVGLAKTGKGNSGETWWDAYNGVTEYFSHVYGRNADNRLTSLWFGQNTAKVETALQTAVELSGIATAS